MANQYDSELRGVLFRVENRQSEKHPSHEGSAQIDGVDYFMDAWVNESKNGKKYFSIKFKPKDKQPKKAHQIPTKAAPKPSAEDDDFDDVPF